MTTLADLNLATSRYKAKKRIKASGLSPVGISVGEPKFPLGYELAGTCPILAPARWMLSMDRERYEAIYRARLEEAGVERIVAELAALKRPGDAGVVLLCYEDLEKPGEWCHRRMLACWLEEQTGIEVPELEGEPAREKQGMLF
jgi:uncharacterized protein (UPF0248 family)